jgi:hypothetical protein
VSRSKKTQFCAVEGCPRPPQAIFLCGNHYYLHRTGQEDYSNQIAIKEVLQINTLVGEETYKMKLRSILRGVNASKQTRREFNAALTDAYRNANGGAQGERQ